MDIEKIKKIATPILKEKGVIRSSIFGSYAHGKAKEGSDVDFLIEFPEDKSLFDLVDLKLSLEDALGRDVDIAEYRSIKPRIRDVILNSQVAIYG
ncbi:MAG: nucleotidyltransferase family protein [Parcubacteria group bacterium]